MKRFNYADSDGFCSAEDRSSALAQAQAALDDDGGVIYDDSRAFIVVDAEETEEGVRVSGDTLSHEQVYARLSEMTAAGWDFYQPIDLGVLCSFTTNIDSYRRDFSGITSERGFSIRATERAFMERAGGSRRPSVRLIFSADSWPEDEQETIYDYMRDAWTTPPAGWSPIGDAVSPCDEGLFVDYVREA